MAQPSTRSELITYAKRQLGAPVLEINVADEQVEDLLDDAIQYFQERHFDGVYPSFLKYKLPHSVRCNCSTVLSSNHVLKYPLINLNTSRQHQCGR